MVHRPADDLEVVASGFCDHGRSYKVAADTELAGTDFHSALDGFFELAVIEQASHEGWLGAADCRNERGIERDNNNARNFAGFAKRTNEGVLAAPRTSRFQFQIENDVVTFG